MHQYKAQGTFDSPYRFNGKELDQETGLAYYGARYYDNKVGVWMSVDPPLVTETLDSYVFTGSNPVLFIDPDGQDVNIKYLTDKNHIHALSMFLKN